MNSPPRWSLGLGLVLLLARPAFSQTPAPPEPGDAARVASELVLPGREEGQPVRPLSEGPLHEAFLSPSKSDDPDHVAKSPPPPITERPGVESPDPRAVWIGGYWEWDPRRSDFTWVTGTWRVPPPGRFW